jgi:hypothetical protein
MSWSAVETAKHTTLTLITPFAVRESYRHTPPERDGFRLNRHRALDLWWSMIFSENRYPLFRIMLYSTVITGM